MKSYGSVNCTQWYPDRWSQNFFSKKWPLICFPWNRTWYWSEKNVHNQHPAWALQDVSTLWRVGYFFLDYSKFHRDYTQRNQKCGNLQNVWLLYGTSQEQLEKCMMAVTQWYGRLREKKNFIINKIKSNSKPLTTVWFLGYSSSNDRVKHEDRLVEKNFGTKMSANHNQYQSLANFCGQMNQKFATKLLSLKD